MPATVSTPVTALQQANKPSSPPQTTLKPTKKRERINVVNQKTPVNSRPRLSENYEKPASSRDGWWRATIRETPIPGSYESSNFLDDLGKKKMSYRFKSDGRRLEPQPQIGKGAILLPGAYEHEDLAKRAEKFRSTYGFKDTARDAKDVLNFGKKDKDINVPPNVYNTEQYLTLTVDKQPSKHSMFKSQSHRFPTVQFVPKEGPPPGNYDSKAIAVNKSISSSFKSKTPRFATSHTKIPGPGTYAATMQAHIPETVATMGRNHGIFFSSCFTP